ncbi:MAG: four-carbon acid sugar kinase family protein [Acidimicrobiia bacterium]|nr:four-carbon acid sugar kinase family protein [Acidimicrobiia bacterium]
MAPARSAALPDGQVVAWYGDDLTGAAAVLEVLASAGMASVLFMDIPTEEELAPYASWPGIGIAGTARHRDPLWMDAHLPEVFKFLSSLSAPIAHYKVCSTFDSSPEVGSIGKAFELAQPMLGGEWTPLLVAAPPIGRYQSFGNLFAAADGVIYRLDRHPTMSRHPVTPMHEADLRVHLAAQTGTSIGLVDSVSLNTGRALDTLQREINAGGRIISLDVTDDAMLLEVGQLIWETRGDRILAIGSQGVEYALVRYWHEMGLIEGEAPPVDLEPAKRFAAVSASVSPVTASQIDRAGKQGFELIRMDVAASIDTMEWTLEIDDVSSRAVECIEAGGSPIVYTALGPDDPSVSALSIEIDASGNSAAAIRERIGIGLGQVLNQLIVEAEITRCAVVGGDTSGHVTRAIGVRTLTFLAPMGHATSMMAADTGSGRSPMLEYTLKGGQMGSVDFFEAVRGLESSSRKERRT